MKNSENEQTGRTPERRETRWDPEKGRYSQTKGIVDQRQTDALDQQKDAGNIPPDAEPQQNGSLTQDEDPK
jgi:hypothetical protein